MSKNGYKDASWIESVLDRYRVTSGVDFDLDRFAPDDLPEQTPDKREAKTALAKRIERLSSLQELLYANRSWSLLIILQAMDAAGKDSAIKHVMSGVNPQGVSVISFKAPGPHELARDFLWRVHKVAPARGMIGVFNRSHYEDVLVTRVHEDLLEAARLPASLRKGDHFWNDRISDIAAFEAYLGRQGTRVLKFYLNLGRKEQKKRFLARLEDPDKTWKFDAGDVRERAFWDRYREAYQAAIGGTATQTTPWYIVPADRKWFTRLVVIEAIIAAIEALDLAQPEVSESAKAEMAEAKRVLER